MEINFEESVIKKSHSIPVVTQFTASWCGPCKIIKPMLVKANKERDDFEVVTVDVDTNPQPSMQYGIRAVPTIYMFQNGQVVSKYTGGFSAVKLDNWLNTLINP